MLPHGSAVNRHHTVLSEGLYDRLVARRKIPTTFTGFAARLSEALKARQAEDPKKFSIRYVEREAGLSSGQWQKWQKGIRGKGVRVDTLKGLARALRVNQEWLEGEGGPRDITAETTAQRARRRAERDNVPARIIEAVLTLEHADTLDEEMLYRLMTVSAKVAVGKPKREPSKEQAPASKSPASEAAASSRRKLAVSDD